MLHRTYRSCLNCRSVAIGGLVGAAIGAAVGGVSGDWLFTAMWTAGSGALGMVMVYASVLSASSRWE